MSEISGNEGLFGANGSKQPFPVLSKGEIHLWTACSVDSNDFIAKCHSALTDLEKSKIDYYKFQDAKNNFVVSQGGLRLLLSAYLDIAPKDLKIGRHNKGKPFSQDDYSLTYNISNSGNRVVYAISRAGEVGIDLEQIRPLPDLEELIDNNFTKNEAAYIRKLEEEKLTRFFKFWTVKEGYLKAIGEGMRLTPDSLEFKVENGNYKLLEAKGFIEQVDWNTKNVFPADGFVCTLFYSQENAVISDFLAPFPFIPAGAIRL
jgi:4'-phosphopantetheinyl transferase